MKIIKQITLILAVVFTFLSAAAQNVSLNILTQNSGIVNMGGTVFLEITVCNTDPATAVPSYKLRPQISVPSAIAGIPATGHVLPAGWAITFNSGSVIRLSNGTDNVPANTCRTILLAMNGIAFGGPSTISGNLLFSNGVAPGSASGIALPGDLTADNGSQSTIQVVGIVPITLTNFSAALINCQPSLSWFTESEINSDRFEIERSNQYAADWVTVGVVTAGGNSSTKVKYSFIDNTVSSSEKILYRLKMIDRNGHYQYSGVLPVYANCKTINVHAYPNPARNSSLYVSITGAEENSDGALISSAGQLISKQSLINGTNLINVSKIAAGEYTLLVTFKNGGSRKLKILISN